MKTTHNVEDDFFALKEDDLKIKPSVVQIDVAKLNQCTSYCIFIIIIIILVHYYNTLVMYMSCKVAYMYSNVERYFEGVHVQYNQT